MGKNKKVLTFLTLLAFMTISLIRPVAASAATNDITSKVNQIFYKDGATLKEIVNYSYDENGKIIGEKIITGESAIKAYLKNKILEDSDVKKSINKQPNSVVSPMYLGERRVIEGWTYSWRQHLWNNYGGPGGIVSGSIGQTFSTSLTLSTSVSNQIITAGIGVTILTSLNIVGSYNHPIPDGQYGFIDCGVEWNKITFDIEERNLFSWEDIGDGSYEYIVGTSFYYYDMA